MYRNGCQLQQLDSQEKEGKTKLEDTKKAKAELEGQLSRAITELKDTQTQLRDSQFESGQHIAQLEKQRQVGHILYSHHSFYTQISHLHE